MSFSDQAKIDIKDGKHMLFVGRTSTGKTHTLKWLFHDICKEFDYGIVVCGSGFINDDYDFIPDDYKYEDLPIDVIENLVEDQKDKKMKEKMEKRNGGSYKCPKVFMILDDIIGTADFRYGEGKIFNQITKWRHFNISTFWIIQHVKYLPPAIRSSSSVIFTTKVQDTNMDTVYDLCSQGFENKREFKKYVDTNSIDHQVLMFDMSNPYDKDYIKILKPPSKIHEYKLLY